MLRLQYHITNACLVAFDLALTAGCLLFVLRWPPMQGGSSNWDVLVRPAGLVSILCLCGGWFSLLFFWGLYQSRRVDWIFSDSPILFKASSAGLLIAEALSRWLPAPFSSNYFLPRFFVTTLVVLAVARSLLRLLFRKLRELGLNAKNLLIAASSDSGDRIAQTIVHHVDYGYRLVQRLNYSGANGSGPDSFLEEFRAQLRAHRIDDVILALPGGERRLEMECIEECENLAINVRIVPDLLPMIQANSQFFNLGGIPHAVDDKSRDPLRQASLGCHSAEKHRADIEPGRIVHEAAKNNVGLGDAENQEQEETNQSGGCVFHYLSHPGDDHHR